MQRQWQARQAKQKQRQARRQAWQTAFADDPINLRKLPQRVVLKARVTLETLAEGADYWQLTGKRLKAARDIISIPVTRRYRLLCRQDGRSLTPLKVISHEDYNPLVQAHRRLRHWLGKAAR